MGSSSTITLTSKPRCGDTAAMRAIISSLIWLLIMPNAMAFPAFFLQPSLTKVVPAPSGVPGCSDQPTQAYGRHPSVVNDADTIFTLTDSTLKTSTTYCPGQTYSLQIKFPNKRLALVTTSVGTFPAAKSSCTQRLALDPFVDSTIIKSSTFDVDLKVPCSAAGTMTIKVTSAASQTDSFRQSTFSASMDTSCAQCTAAPSPASPAVTTSLQAAMSADMVAYLNSSSSTQMCAVPVQAGAPCTKSSLGYTCSQDLGTFVLHWTLGGCPPINSCTRMSKSFIGSQTNVSQQMLHVAVTASTTGYVALGFARSWGEMPGNDAIIGWASAASTLVNSYYVKSTSVSFDDAYSGSAQWLVLAGVVEASKKTTLCFTRPITAPSAAVAQVISTIGSIKMHYAFGGKGVDYFQQHKEVGKLSLNLATNKASAQAAANAQLAHGILMAIAWVFLAPLGIMFARHKYLLHERKWGEIHVWFITHRGIQVFAVAIFLLSFILAMVKLEEPEGRIGEVHAVLGYLLVALAGCQVLGTFVRPKPGTEHRRAWNLFHWNMGSLSVLTGITNVYIGIYIYSDGNTRKLQGWLISVSLVLLAYVCTEFLLQLRACRSSRTSGSPAPVSTKPKSGTGPATIVAAAAPAKL